MLCLNSLTHYTQYRSNTFHCRTWLPGWILLFLSLGLMIGVGVFYQHTYSPQLEESRHMQLWTCNTTLLISLINTDGTMQGFLTAHVNTAQTCIWTNLDFFECRHDDVFCILSNTNQVDNDDWPCFLHMLNNSFIDCTRPPLLTHSDFADSSTSRIFIAWILISVFICIAGIAGISKTQCNRKSDIPLLDADGLDR